MEMVSREARGVVEVERALDRSVLDVTSIIGLVWSSEEDAPLRRMVTVDDGCVICK